MNLAKKEIEIKHILQRVDAGMAEISPLITKKLIEEFEKTGVSPVFSKNGKITSLKFVETGSATNIVGEDHWRDLENAIKNCQCSLGDFWFLEYDQSKYSDNKIYLIAGKLLVVSKKSGKSQEYDVGHDSTFPYDLIQDIKNNFFKI